jgi:UDP-N-acetylglucosamine 2-epimerase (non-hydrolysing)
VSEALPPIFIVGGARPNFMKIAPLVWQLTKKRAAFRLIHTGQHYDYEMSRVFFDELDIPEPDYFLKVGSGTHSEQTARIMVEFEKTCAAERPEIVVVVGDVNSTLACSVCAKKLDIPVAHVEAGLRSGDMTMPEEINRIVTDSISDYLFVTEQSGIYNLRRAGRNESQIFFVGNVMIDTLYYGLKKLRQKPTPRPTEDPFGVVTLHRPSNVDNKKTLSEILLALTEISDSADIYFPMHPRTAKNIRDFRLKSLLKNSRVKILAPLSYLEFLSLWKDADFVMTDSGGLQEETTSLGVACFTIRENTERPVTVEEGTNVLVGTERAAIVGEFRKFREGHRKRGRVPEFWDGKTAERIVDLLLAHSGPRGSLFGA